MLITTHHGSQQNITHKQNYHTKSELLHFKNTRVNSSRDFDMRSLCVLINSPLYENTRSTGTDVAEPQRSTKWFQTDRST